MAIDKTFYNENSSRKLGWAPDWFGVEEYDEDLTAAITDWQRDNGLQADGLCGPGTFKVLVEKRRAATAKEVEEDNHKTGKHFYNESSSERLGWQPDWFGEGLTDFDDELLEAIKQWQRDNDITDDGLCGPGTFRRIWTERESEIDEHEPEITRVWTQQHIVHNGKFIPIEWDRVVLWSDEGGLRCHPGTYSSYAGKPDRKPNHFVNHWDVCKSTKSMARVIARRGISIHFGVDVDGTIYQLLDTQHAAWQAGGRKWNHTGIGVEICNPYYEKYQDADNPRPVINGGACHGRSMKPFLGFHRVQIEALTALWAAIHQGVGIPLEVPLDENGEPETGVDARCEAAKFDGFINHFNLTRRKIDCAHPSLDMKQIAKDAKDIVRRTNDGVV